MNLLLDMALIALGAALINNFVLYYFLGICPLIGVSKKLDAALSMGIAVTFVMTLTAAANVSERKKIQAMAAELPHVHVVEPVSLGGGMGHYSGEDMPEKSSMMAYSDVMVTVYSTMVVEASLHGTPVVSLVIDSANRAAHRLPSWRQPQTATHIG